MSDLSELRQTIADHTRDDHTQFQALHQTLKSMKENDLHHIQGHVETIVTEIKEIKSDLKANTKDTQEARAEVKDAKTNIDWIIKIGGGAWAILLIIFTAMVFVIREAFTK